MSAQSLVGVSTDELRAEIARRERVAEDEMWERRKRTAKYLCYACGMPDSYHTRDCPTDTDCA